MLITIDRFEGEFAVCELHDKSFANLPKLLLPEGSIEGSKLSINLDKASEADDLARISAKMDQLFTD